MDTELKIVSYQIYKEHLINAEIISISLNIHVVYQAGFDVWQAMKM